jgi:hypothetical protein
VTSSVFFYFNRGLKLSLNRFVWLSSFLALLASGISYTLTISLDRLLTMNWHFIAVQGLAITTATFWIFLGVCFVVRFCHARIAHQSSHNIFLRAMPTLVKSAFKLSYIFAIACGGLWGLLIIKYFLLQLPYVGPFFSIFLAWLPLLVILVLKIAPWLLGAILYLVVPMIAVQGQPLKHSCLRWLNFWKSKPLETLLCTIIGLAPLIFAAWVVGSLQRHTIDYLASNDGQIVEIMRDLIVSLASAALMAPALSLFAAWGLESLFILETSTQRASSP